MVCIAATFETVVLRRCYIFFTCLLISYTFILTKSHLLGYVQYHAESVINHTNFCASARITRSSAIIKYMKILYLYKDYYPVLGGVENYIKQLAEAMQARGHQVEVLVTNTHWRGTHQIIAGIHVTKSGRLLNLASAPLSLTMFSQLYQRLLKSDQRPDIIHLQFPYPTGELAWLSSQLLLLGIGQGKQRPKTVLTYHSDIVRQRRLLKFYSPFLRQVLQRVDKILATSPQYIASSPWLQSVASKCVVAPLGVDYTRFATVQKEQVAAIKARYGLKQPLVLFAGRLRYYKGLQYLLRAWPLLQHNAKLLIIGIGPMEATWKAEAAQLGLTTERVVFLGEISDADLPAYYQAADLFVLPASERSEAFGIVQLEAMAAGCPVITTELGTGTSYVNQNGETGLVVSPNDPTALSAALNQLLSDPALRQRMSEQAQARIQSKFSIEQMVNQTEAIYRELVPKTAQ